MKKDSVITALFLDIGGVLLTDGWNRASRKNAAKNFNLDYDDMEERHHLTFDTYEVGKLSLEEYLNRIVFFEKRNFTPADFRTFMYDQSKPYKDMLQLIPKLKKQYNLKVAVVSNEGRELTEHRIKKFKLYEFVDFFISSCFVHLRKPDIDIFQAAIDIAQVKPKEVIYIEDRPMFVQVGSSLGLNGIHHEGYGSTVEKLSRFGLG